MVASADGVHHPSEKAQAPAKPAVTPKPSPKAAASSDPKERQRRRSWCRPWHLEHTYFRRLLDWLQKEVDLFATGERPNYELMLDILTYLREFTDRVHHPREDVAFERLVRRFPEMQLPLARLQQEHRVIAHAGETLRGLLAAILDGSVVPRAEVEAAAATYLVYYGNHIAKEEEDVLSRAAAALSREDWDAVRDAVPHTEDPLFGPAPEARFRQLRRQIALEA